MTLSGTSPRTRSPARWSCRPRSWSRTRCRAPLPSPDANSTDPRSSDPRSTDPRSTDPQTPSRTQRYAAVSVAWVWSLEMRPLTSPRRSPSSTTRSSGCGRWRSWRRRATAPRARWRRRREVRRASPSRLRSRRTARARPMARPCCPRSAASTRSWAAAALPPPLLPTMRLGRRLLRPAASEGKGRSLRGAESRLSAIKCGSESHAHPWRTGWVERLQRAYATRSRRRDVCSAQSRRISAESRPNLGRISAISANLDGY